MLKIIDKLLVFLLNLVTLRFQPQKRIASGRTYRRRRNGNV
jgi:hypothetical protein